MSEKPPASAIERQYWLLHRIYPDATVYHIPNVFYIKSLVDFHLLEAALNQLVNRHEALRTSFKTENDQLVQDILPEVHVPVEVKDYSAVRQQQPGVTPEQIIGREIDRPFDLSRAPLIRAAILVMPEDSFYLVLTLHHIICDLRTKDLIGYELSEIYNALRRNESVGLPPAPFQYQDHARWQARWMMRPEYEKSLEFWKTQLAGKRLFTDMATDFQRPPMQTLKGEALPIRIDNTLTRELARFAKQRRVNLYLILLAAYYVLLYRYTRQSDITIGVPLTNRRRAEDKDTAGCFVNILPVNVDFSEEPDFDTVLRAARMGMLMAHRNQEVPYEEIVNAIVPERERSYNALFQYGFTFEHPMQLFLHGCRVESRRFHSGGARLDLYATFWEEDNGISGSFEFSADIFRPETIRRLARNYQKLLSEIIQQPQLPVSETDIISDAEKETLLYQWNATARRLPEAQTIHRMFENQAWQTPDRIAAAYEDKEITYAELDNKAAALAGKIRQQGVTAGQYVGIFMDRCLDMIVALLGVLKAGCAYVPMDPEFPADRIAYMVSHSGVSVIVCRENERSNLPETRAVVVTTDPAETNMDSALQTASEPEAGPQDPAYLIYTSGSTGLPKGVQIHHRAAVNFLQAMAKTPGIKKDDVLLAVTTLCFDISVLEMFLPLTVGAKVVIAPRQTVADPQELIGTIEDRNITIMQATPTTWRLMAAADWQGKPGFKLLCGGEPLPRDLAGQLTEMDSEVWNMYGPTETTVWSTCQRLEADQPKILVGHPIDNTQLYILDKKQQLIPAGAIGELYIGGAGVAKGYFRQPELTEKRFIVNPFGDDPEDRLYQTGDLARFDIGGTLELLGRDDQQIKLHGYRIEPSEIESVIARHPDIKTSVVVVREDRPGDKRLVAYVVSKRGGDIHVAELRRLIQQYLPAYMVPSIFWRLPALPLTPNKKIDRKALPEPGTVRAETGRVHVAAKNETEKTLVEIWSQVLGVAAIGVDDSFFDLGGTSLLAVNAVEKTASHFGIRIPVAKIFQYPTIGQLQRYLREELARRDSGDAASPKQLKPIAAAKGKKQRIAAAGAAVIGMAGRFPGASDLNGFWENLCAAKESISFFTPEQIDPAIDPEVRNHPNYVPAKGILENAEMFDAGFFGITPREAEIMDPQHRVFLETAWHALEDAGYSPDRTDGRIGLFAGMSNTTYYHHHVMSRPDLVKRFGPFQAMLLNEKDYLTTRTSYLLDLKGPSVNVYTACSTSLVAVCHAWDSLMSGASDLALAGGISVVCPLNNGHLYTQGGISSKDGHCRPFDQQADGTVWGNGVGLVVLKRYEEAVADGDRIYAVVRGCGLNNDGADKVSFTAPSVEGQFQAIARAQQEAGISPEKISYVEAHGTATPLGDAIEIEALNQAFGDNGTRKHACWIGSVKGNIGHLDTAAGIAGFIKAVLCLKHQQIPPTVHFQAQNDNVAFQNGPFVVTDRLINWDTGGRSRFAAVSSFGIGGTNAHVILEQAPEQKETTPTDGPILLVFSANSEPALERLTDQLAAHFKENPSQSPADAAFTLQTGRHDFAHRRTVVCENLTEAAAALENRQGAGIRTAVCKRKETPVVFMFTGQGSQYPGMGRGIYDRYPVFRSAIDQCADLVRQETGTDLNEWFNAGKTDKDAARRLTETATTQPALFVLEYALARLWMSWGIQPAAMIGHSIGEYTAACLAGVFSLEDAIRLVVARGQLMQNQPPGAMMGVSLAEEEIGPWIEKPVWLAAVNAPRRCVLSGPSEAINELHQRIKQQRAENGAPIQSTLLHTSHAFHSEMMDPALAPFTALVEKTRLHPPQIPFISNLTGDWMSTETATDPSYWARHLRHTVRFSQGIATLIQDLEPVFLEVGPGNTLTTLSRQHFTAETQARAVSCLSHARQDEPDEQMILSALGQLWVSGVRTDWKGFWQHQQQRKIQLPLYPFEPHRFWIDPQGPASVVTQSPQTDDREKMLLAAADYTGGSLHPRPELRSAYKAPENETQKSLVGIWQDIFGIEQIGIEDDFFDMGGDSLVASQLTVRIGEQFRVELTVKDLFEHPSIEQYARLLDAVLSDRTAVKKPEPALSVPVAARKERLPLTLSQQRLWFIQKLEPDSPAHNIVQALEFSGSLDSEALYRAFVRVQRRHEIFRMVFDSVDGQPFARIIEHAEISFETVDLRQAGGNERTSTSAEEPRKSAATFIRNQATAPFDLSQGPLYRALLLRLNDAEAIFALIFHHIIADGTSMGVWMRDLMAEYAACKEGRDSPLPESRQQYADFAAWQEKWLAQTDFGNQIAYWKQQMGGEIPILQLPVDYLRPPVPTYRGTLESIELDSELTGQLKDMARRERTTLFITLMAALTTLLKRYTGQDTIVVGTPHASRDLPETQEMIGMFLNMLPIRADLKEDMSFRSVLARIRETSAGAYANKDLPFERLVEILKPKRSLTHHPLFQVMFSYQNVELPLIETKGLTAKPVFMDRGASEYDLALYMWEEEGRLKGALEYSTDLFRTDAMARMSAHFQNLLREITRDPDRSIGVLPIMAEQEHQQMAEKWNATRAFYPKDTTVVGLFEQTAEKRPDAAAVAFENRQMTYAELNHLANHLASTLHDMGISTQDRVGIRLQRGMDMAVAILAVLKAGAAYVPLDPDFPADRISFMIQDAGIRCLLTHQALSEQHPLSHAVEEVFLDADKKHISGQVGQKPLPGPGPQDPAYIIYTSGSTGKPKGVQILHRSLVNFLCSMKKEPGLSEDDTLLSVTTMSFDIFGLELFLPLMTGARTVIVSRENAADGSALMGLLEKTGANVMQATPGTWRLMLEAGWTRGHGVKALCGGEALPPDLAEQILKTGAELWNLYGPTETTIWSAAMKVRSGDMPPRIGLPIANTQFYVLDSSGGLLPIGIAGELHIGGDGLAAVYLNRPELTAEKFIPDPFSADPKARLYKTGDLVKRLSDGTLEFLGRMDHQIKIRGFRVELGEIEEGLNQHPFIKDSVVAVSQAAADDNRLVAYFVSNNADNEPDEKEIRAFLKKRLPDYMVPSLFIRMASFPLTPNGKKDRKALPAPETVQTPAYAERLPPRDALETTLSEIWKDLLGRKNVSIHDDFFDIGGHSLLAARMFARIEKELGKNLPLALLFEHSTIEKLAAVMRQGDVTPEWTTLVPIKSKGSRPPLFLVHGAEGNVLLYRDLADHLKDAQPVYGLQSEGLSGSPEFDPRVETMAENYISEIRKVQPHGPYFLGGYCMGGMVAFEMARQLEAMDEPTALVALIETYNIHIDSNHLSKRYLYINKIQNIVFHAGNLLIAEPKDMWRFFTQKAGVEMSRASISLNSASSRFKKLWGKPGGLHFYHQRVDTANDRASVIYRPKPYSGKVTLFITRKDFAGFSDPLYGWGDLAEKGVAVHRLPCYPRGTLVEPHVARLAEALTASIAATSTSEGMNIPANSQSR